MDQIAHPILLYAGLALGAVGVCLAMPRRRPHPQILGALLAAAAGGLVLLALALAAAWALPNLFFYVFALIALGSALRVITHPRPVYAALFFILTIVSSAGLYVLLAAEFMAFALIIVYAGAILITYLFVIMLATQSPRAEAVDALAEYDRVSREPLAATAVGFVLLAAMTTMIFRGTAGLEPGRRDDPDALLASMPRLVERALREHRTSDGTPALREGERVASVDPAGRTAVLAGAAGTRSVPLPEGLRVTNTDAVGFNLLRDHPGTIEIAGVILLMAMLGAVVLARKQVELDEEAKARHAAKLEVPPARRGRPSGGVPAVGARA